MTDYSVHIVIDNGSDSCKAGFNGENAPRVAVPSVVGKMKDKTLNLIADPDKNYIGREALYNASCLDLSSPFRNGLIHDFDKMEKIWANIFYDSLKVKPEAHNVFLTESLHSHNKEREKVAEIMFEKFSVFNIHIEPQSLMSLYSTTKTSGLIIDSGEANTHVVPIFDGYIIPQGIKTFPIAGKVLTESLLQNIKDQLRQKNVANESMVCKKIKEKYLELIADGNPEKKQIELPDGSTIDIKDEIHNVPEAIFRPDLVGYDIPGLHHMVIESVRSTDVFLRKELLGNMVISGGNTLIKKFPERLKSELSAITKQEEINSFKITAQDERMYASWIGSSVVCSISTFQQMWISKNDYEEIGSQIIHRKNNF